MSSSILGICKVVAILYKELVYLWNIAEKLGTKYWFVQMVYVKPGLSLVKSLWLILHATLKQCSCSVMETEIRGGISKLLITCNSLLPYVPKTIVDPHPKADPSLCPDNPELRKFSIKTRIDHLAPLQVKPLSWSLRIKLAKDIAAGMVSALNSLKVLFWLFY